MAPLGAEKKKKRFKFSERFSSGSKTTTTREGENSESSENTQLTPSTPSTSTFQGTRSSQSSHNTHNTHNTRSVQSTQSIPNTRGVSNTESTRSTQSIQNTNTNTTSTKKGKRKSKTESKVERIMKELGINEHNPTSTPLEDGPQTALHYSVFFGNPTSANSSLDHFLIKTTVTEELLNVGQDTRSEDEKPFCEGIKPGDYLALLMKSLDIGQKTRDEDKETSVADSNLETDQATSKKPQNVDQNTHNDDGKPLTDDAISANGLTVSKCLASLATRYNNQILALPPQICSVCLKPSPEALVHRALFWSLEGYGNQDDGAVMETFMRHIASCVKNLNTKEKIAEAIGGAGRGAYIHEMAAAVCREESECHAVATSNIENFIASNMKDAKASRKHTKEDSKGTSQVQHGAQVWRLKDINDKAMVYVNEAGWELVDDDDNDDGKSLFPEAASYIDAGMVAAPNDLVKFRLSVFCGRPILDPDTPPRRGRISSLVFTSKWPTSFASGGAGKLYEQEYQNYRVIAGFHNQHILQAANFCCVMCADEKPATELVHHLISFKRDNTIGAQADGIKKSVMKLFQFVEGRWKFPEMNAALSPDGRCHINEWAVPICSRNSNCEALARLAVKEAMRRLMPEDVRPHYLDMFRDTVFSRPFPHVQGGKYPKVVVKKLAGGIANDDGEIMVKAPKPEVLDKEVDVFFKEMRVLVDAETERRRAEDGEKGED